MNTLRIENRVHNYDSWRQTFDKFDALRREKGVRAYRVSRPSDDPLRVFIDLDFDSPTRAEDFRETLAKIWRTPQSRDQLADHVQPLVLDILADVHYPTPAPALDTDTGSPRPSAADRSGDESQDVRRSAQLDASASVGDSSVPAHLGGSGWLWATTSRSAPTLRLWHTQA